MSVLEVNGLCGGYGKTPIIWDVSMKAKVGQVVSIVGPNGAGKSTFMKSLFGITDVTGGSVILDGQNVRGLPSFRLARAGMAYVPQVDNIFTTMTIKENLEMGAYSNRRGLAQRVDVVLDIFPDLKKAHNRKGGELSGGQRNMLGMARALMADPKVLLLDEPTAGLSPIYVDVVWDQVGRIAKTGTSIVVIEQNVDRAIANSEWVYVLVAGRNRLDGPASQVAELDLGEIFLGATAAAHDTESEVVA